MYFILVNEDNTLSAPKKERIMQRSKLVDTLCFLANPIYKERDMTNSTVVLEYVLPVSKKYCSEILTLSDERYEEFLKYLLPFDTNLTIEAGKIELQLSFVYVDLDADGKAIQRVRKTSTISVEIIPISAWSDIIPDSALTAIDQRIVKVDSQIKALDDMNKVMNNIKADNIKLDAESGELYLTVNGEKLGDAILLNELGDAISEETESGLVQVITDEEIEIPDGSGNKETITYSLYLDQETDELCLIANGQIVDRISTKDIGESIVDSTDEGLNEIIL